MQYILPQSPFCPMKEFINIPTREVAGRNANADESYKIELKIIESMTGVDTDKFIFKKKDQSVIMKSKSSIKIDYEKIFVNQCFFFKDSLLQPRVLAVMLMLRQHSRTSYELCIFPLALQKTMVTYKKLTSKCGIKVYRNMPYHSTKLCSSCIRWMINVT